MYQHKLNICLRRHIQFRHAIWSSLCNNSNRIQFISARSFKKIHIHGEYNSEYEYDIISHRITYDIHYHLSANSVSQADVFLYEDTDCF